MSVGIKDQISPEGVFSIVCVGGDGSIKWIDETYNMVVTQGKNDLFNKYFNGVAYTSLFFVGIKGVGDVALTDTMLSHSGWNEITTYLSASRPAFVASVSTVASVNNNSNAVTFVMTGAAQIGGCFISTSSSGVTGVLFSAANFTSTRAVSIGDTMIITYTVSC